MGCIKCNERVFGKLHMHNSEQLSVEDAEHCRKHAKCRALASCFAPKFGLAMSHRRS